MQKYKESSVGATWNMPSLKKYEIKYDKEYLFEWIE